MNETWVTIQNYPDYQISSTGSVKSLKRNKEKILNLQKGTHGYLHVNLCKEGKLKTFKVHKLVGTAFLSNPFNLPQINHLDGVKTNNNIWNLEWVNNSDNSKHAFRLNLRSNQGEKHPRSKLKEKDIIQIKSLYKNKKHTQKNLAELFNVSPQLIYYITSNRSWKSLSEIKLT